MEANLNQFRLLTVEGEQLANAQRRGSHGDDIGCLKGSPLVKHRLVYEDCPYFDSSKSSKTNDKLRKSSSTRSKDQLSCQLHTSLSHEPAICDHPHHHHRRHHQLCRHLRGITTFQAKSRPRSQSNRQLSLQQDADDDDDDDSRSSRRSLPLSEESEALLQQISCRNKTPQDVFLGLEDRKRSKKGFPEKDEETSTLELVEERIEDEKKKKGEENLINSIKSLEKTMILHCQLLSKRLARERTTVQQKFNGDSKHHHHQRPVEQPSLAHVTPKTNVRVDKVSVYMRVIFLKIGEIDTMKENFMADAFIQARWREPALDGLQSQLLSAQSMEDVEWDKYWNPKLYVENNLGEPKETIWQTVSYGLKGEATVYERRRIKGCFLENLELDDFPFDTQELTLTITSERSDTELELNEDNIEISSINVQSFVDEQEWALHSHVETWKCITTKIFQNSKLKHPSFSTSCRASRRAGFYIWNIFLVMLFICSLTFATFSVELTKPENRLQLSFILLLTTITFKFVVSQTLPRISYLTYLDKYILTSMGILCGVCVWHAVIPLFKQDAELAKVADKWGLVVFSSCYFLFHLFFFLYIYIMALKRRWKYDQKDRDHKERVRKLQMLQEQQSRLDVVERQNQLLVGKSENPKNTQLYRDKINDCNETTTAMTFGSNNKMDARCDSRLNLENQKATVDDTTLQIYTRHISLEEV